MKTNNLKHKISCKDIEGNDMVIVISLNDECHNGHQDFSITGSIYEKDKPHIDRYFISGGCIHDHIIAARPDLQIFVNLHLSDASGVPMYAVENGFYHLQNGFNEKTNLKRQFCEYYRITPKQFDVINTSENKLQFALYLQSLGILKQWNDEAKKAIKLLEKFTGNEFISDSQKSQFTMPTAEEMKDEQIKQSDGYYTPEAKAAREIEKANKAFNKIEADRQEKITSINLEFDTKQAVLLAGGENALSNCIYYNHIKTVCFNWKSYDMISESDYNKIVKLIKLPEGVIIRNDKGRN